MTSQTFATDLQTAEKGQWVVRRSYFAKVYDANGRPEHFIRYTPVEVTRTIKSKNSWDAGKNDRISVNNERTQYKAWNGLACGTASGALIVMTAADVEAKNAEQEALHAAAKADADARAAAKAEAKAQRMDETTQRLQQDFAAMRKVPTANGILHIVDTVLRKWDEDQAVTFIVRQSGTRREYGNVESEDRVVPEWEVSTIANGRSSSSTVVADTVADAIVAYVDSWYR